MLISDDRERPRKNRFDLNKDELPHAIKRIWVECLSGDRFRILNSPFFNLALTQFGFRANCRPFG